MKVKIRRSTFETNSSSCHSLVIKSEHIFDEVSPLRVDRDLNKVIVFLDEFDGEYELTNDPYRKLQFLLSLDYYQKVVCSECTEEEYYNSRHFCEINNIVAKKYDCDGVKLCGKDRVYIDHQSAWDDFEDIFGDDYSYTIEDFIFNPKKFLHAYRD